MLEELCTQLSAFLLLIRNYNHEESSLPTRYHVFSSPIWNKGFVESPCSKAEDRKTQRARKCFIQNRNQLVT